METDPTKKSNLYSTSEKILGSLFSQWIGFQVHLGKSILPLPCMNMEWDEKKYSE